MQQPIATVTIAAYVTVDAPATHFPSHRMCDSSQYSSCCCVLRNPHWGATSLNMFFAAVEGMNFAVLYSSLGLRSNSDGAKSCSCILSLCASLCVPDSCHAGVWMVWQPKVY